ncbi:hypothetical protein [Pseudochrobactrum asaccharolyticum]|uniref:Uncharacterized protein n=1 Tax=Pseudochrobactrum asaccharolyticum TaxID=354351 RepID=A0A366DY18_9HYPH|nr:hypothetical protein [Pseudochrobactrum asaccharolyticum]RBO94972.1 hypothetical protein DFR47_104334 [Pseudochrobactrum asaccharolyticum]
MTSELTWFRRLRRVLSDMPDTVEVTVRATGMVCLHERGATDRYFEGKGDTDNVPEISAFRINNIRGEEASI